MERNNKGVFLQHELIFLRCFSGYFEMYFEAFQSLHKKILF